MYCVFKKLGQCLLCFVQEKKFPWCEFAESVEDGPTTMFLKDFCKQYNMVIVSPILNVMNMRSYGIQL